jgi:hypothetical protein
MSVWPHTGGTRQTVAGERTTAFRNCGRGMRWRVTAIIPAVEMAWMQVVTCFFCQGGQTHCLLSATTNLCRKKTHLAASGTRYTWRGGPQEFFLGIDRGGPDSDGIQPIQRIQPLDYEPDSDSYWTPPRGLSVRPFVYFLWVADLFVFRVRPSPEPAA